MELFLFCCCFFLLFTLVFPPFACVCVQEVINTMCGHGMQELEYTEAGEHIHTNGCIDILVNWIHSNLFLLGGIALGLAIPQVGCSIKHSYQHTRACYAQVSTGRDLRGCSHLAVMHLLFSQLQLVGILLSQILINQIKDQIELQNYHLKHRSDPWS